MQVEYAEASDIARELNDRRLLADSMFNESFVPLVTGHPERTIPLLERCLEAADPGDRPFQGRVWISIGVGTMFAGNPKDGIASIERGLGLYRLTNERLASCEALLLLAGAELMLGNIDAAQTHAEEATSIATTSKSPVLIANALLPHAILANRVGRHERAARLVGAWNGLEQEYEIHFPAVGLGFFGDPAADARAALGDEAFEVARSEGLAMDIHQISELLEGDPAGASPYGRETNSLPKRTDPTPPDGSGASV
jgi:hypothetical protein